MNSRPKLSHQTMAAYLDWVVDNWTYMHAKQAEAALTAAELLIRTQANEAQGKATQHTLVENGIIAPPPTASPSA